MGEGIRDCDCDCELALLLMLLKIIVSDSQCFAFGCSVCLFVFFPLYAIDTALMCPNEWCSRLVLYCLHCFVSTPSTLVFDTFLSFSG